MAYVSETCERPNDECLPPGGLVDILGSRTITTGIAQPDAIAFDEKGYAFVANENGAHRRGYVSVYAPGATTPLRTIDKLPRTPRELGIDRARHLYIVGDYIYGCCQMVGFARVYASQGTTLLRELSGLSGFPGRPVFDSADNAYIPNFDTFPEYVAVYPPGATRPSRIIQAGIGFPTSLAFDGTGSLYVLNHTFSHGSDVTVYARGSGKVLRTISARLTNANAMALDSFGNVYVANVATSTAPSAVTVYAAGTTTLVRTIEKGVREPVALAFDTSGNLLVANSPIRATNTVTVYAPEAIRPMHTYRLREAPTGMAAVPPRDREMP